ncbi:hypothetical protein [Nocardia flavorosea]|uniref:DUF8020 domain-containing protein n=1 Tax=Nocardia flavorosea TaxID=53429 RepID=A0A846YDN5_9NOCA|nr:hypothetical protein [Nocardia flavorosea]NKY57143.1 hypothetical protein [Nocardia flavorosea]
MKFAKIAATALLSTAAVGVMAGTAHGEASMAHPVAGKVDGNVGYSMAWSPDRSSATTTLTSGAFAVTENSVEVVAADGEVLEQVPLVYQVAGQEVRLDAQVDAAGTSLTIDRPAAAANGAPVPTAPLKDIASNETLILGAAIGCGIGALIGLVLLIVGALPGCLVGAIVNGGLVMNGQGILPPR